MRVGDPRGGFQCVSIILNQFGNFSAVRQQLMEGGRWETSGEFDS